MGCTAPDGSRMGRVGLRDRVRGGAKGPHRAGRRAPASLRPMRQDPSARVGPPPLTIGRRAALHRGRKSLPRCRTPARMRVVPPAGRMPPELQQRSHNERNVRHDPPAFWRARRGGGWWGWRGEVRPSRHGGMHANGSSSALRHAACGTVAGKSTHALGRSPRAAAWCRHTVTAKAATPQVGMAQGARLTCGLLAR